MTQSLAILAAVLNLAYLVGLAYMHFLPTGYSVMGHAVSDYCVGRYARQGKAVALLSGLGAGCFLLAMLSARALANAQIAELAAYVLLKILILFFPTDLEGEKLTRSGLAHYLIAIAYFALAVFFTVKVTPTLGGDAPGFGLHGILAALALVVWTSVWPMAITLIPALRRVFGLFERIFIVAVAAWFLDASLLLAAA
jgi:hypothetical protein